MPLFTTSFSNGRLTLECLSSMSRESSLSFGCVVYADLTSDFLKKELRYVQVLPSYRLKCQHSVIHLMYTNNHNVAVF